VGEDLRGRGPRAPPHLPRLLGLFPLVPGGHSHPAPGFVVQRALLEPGLGRHGVLPVPGTRRGLEAGLLPGGFLYALAQAVRPLGFDGGHSRCLDLERGIVEWRPLLGVQPRLDAMWIRLRPPDEGLTDGLVTEFPGRLLAEPGHGGCAVPSAPMLGHVEQALSSVTGLQVLRGPRGSALGIPLRGQVGRGPEDRALENPVVALVAQH
jgi:hypothetical protein